MIMKLAGERKVLHLYDVTEQDNVELESMGYVYLGEDINNNEMWEIETNFDVTEKRNK